MKKSVLGAAIGLLFLFALAIPAGITVLAQSTNIYFTDFNTDYSDWNSRGNVASVSSPSIQPNSVRF